jgi:hypothetical protein
MAALRAPHGALRDGLVESDERRTDPCFWNALLLALRAIRRNLMRSFLTVLGIVIGVAAVITMVTLGNGATRMVSQDQISSLGSNLLILRPGQHLGPGRDSARRRRLQAGRRRGGGNAVPSLKAVAPRRRQQGDAGRRRNRTGSRRSSGTSNAYFTAGNWKIASGRPFERRRGSRRQGGLRDRCHGEETAVQQRARRSATKSASRTSPARSSACCSQGPGCDGHGPGRHGADADAHRCSAA